MKADAVVELVPVVGTTAACQAMEVARATHYRRRRPRLVPEPKLRPTPARALSEREREAVLELLHGERFCDRSPAEVYATILDEGTYLASERTMYRILAGNQEVRERRNQLRHPAYQKPELLATGPNEVWTWDITKLRGPAKGIWFHLYVIMDIYSRQVMGWMVAPTESATLAERLIDVTIVGVIALMSGSDFLPICSIAADIDPLRLVYRRPAKRCRAAAPWDLPDAVVITRLSCPSVRKSSEVISCHAVVMKCRDVCRTY